MKYNLIKLSIIIPTYNRNSVLVECLQSIYQNKSKIEFEVIVIFDGKNDETNKVIKTLQKYKNFKYIIQDNKGPGAARNKGLNIAKGKIIAFLDDDTTVNADWIKKIIDAHNTYPDIKIIAGKLLTNNHKLMAEFSKILEYEPLIDGQEIKPSLVNNVSYKKDCFKIVKKFDESMRIGEDIDFNYRLFKQKIRAIYLSNIIIKHRYKEDMYSMIRQQYSFGKGRVKIMFKGDDYPFDKKSILLYIIKRILTPFFDPWLRFKYAIATRKDNAILYLFLGYIQQFFFTLGLIHGIINIIFRSDN
jgi:glycosyltransferase involved in cell wall biosynthesis